MSYYEYESEEKAQALALKKKKQKQKQQLTLLALLLAGVLTFYFLVYLPDEREKVKEEIEKLLNQEPLVSLEESNWKSSLNNLFLVSQISKLKQDLSKEIHKKKEELKEMPKKKREEEIKAMREFLEPDEEELEEIKLILEKFTDKIKRSSLNDLSTVSQEFVNIIQEKRDKRKRLYWKLPANNWADRWLSRNKESFNGIWSKLTQELGSEPVYFDAKAIYKISFPPSLWNELTEEQKILAKLNGHDELKIKDEAWNYKFSPLIEEWKERVISNPIRGEYNPNQPDILDNNALFYGAPRTGKSIIAEIITYEANKYPLITIQGSTLTPNKIQRDLGLDPLLKFIFTISAINYDLADNYGFERVEDGEVRHILFLDEADQICTNNLQPPRDASTQLTFLKECMGSDNKSEESKNLWIAATNHLDNINVAIYQSGRLSNPLDFSWTLEIFMTYAQISAIDSQFPQHWIEETTLNDEDNKWVNKFNKIIFDKDFLPFWQKFITNSDTRKDLNEEKEFRVINEDTGETEEVIKQKGIQWGEFFEFFWQLYDSKQLRAFDGKWRKPRKPTMEEIVEETVKLAANKISADIAKAVDTRLREMNETAQETRVSLEANSTTINDTVSRSLSEISGILTEIGSKIRST